MALTTPISIPSSSDISERHWTQPNIDSRRYNYRLSKARLDLFRQGCLGKSVTAETTDDEIRQWVDKRDLLTKATAQRACIEVAFKSCRQLHASWWEDLRVPNWLRECVPSRQTESGLLALPNELLIMIMSEACPLSRASMAISCKQLLQIVIAAPVSLPSARMHRYHEPDGNRCAAVKVQLDLLVPGAPPHVKLNTWEDKFYKPGLGLV